MVEPFKEDVYENAKTHYGVLAPNEENWQALLIFNSYRFGLSLTLVLLASLKAGPSFLGQQAPIIYPLCTQLYLFFATLFLLASLLRKADFSLQVNVPVFVDILVITTILHLSGGSATGLGLLLVITVAAHSLLASHRMALFGAAIASCAILSEQLYRVLTNLDMTSSSTQAGLLGLCIFVTAICCSKLKQKLYSMQKLAYQRGLRLANSHKLNKQVVDFMQQGVIVFDDDDRVELINQVALNLLGPLDEKPSHLNRLPLSFQQAYSNWKRLGDDKAFSIGLEGSEIRLLGQLPHSNQQGVHQVVFLHDVSGEARKAQHMKLAMLGSFAANIAHEIRNPLSSASHAAQLLNESNGLSSQDQHLVQMIKKNCDRMNLVIKNVLSISKKQSNQPQRLEINAFIQQFIDDFHMPGQKLLNIQFYPSHEPVYVTIDPNQFRQLLVNLCENGLRYSLRHLGEPKLTIRLNPAANHTLQIHVTDYGPGVEPQAAKHLFEPFFTTENQGSGLGLYISREICQINGGDLHYQAQQPFGSDFCIQLPIDTEASLNERA